MNVAIENAGNVDDVLGSLDLDDIEVPEEGLFESAEEGFGEIGNENLEGPVSFLDFLKALFPVFW